MKYSNTYDENNQPRYEHYISEICYRLKLKVYREDQIDGVQDVIWKEENGTKTELVNSENHPRNELWFWAWKKLRDDYDLNDVFWAYGGKEPFKHDRQF